MTAALDTLPPHKWREFGDILYVPRSKLDQIESQFTSDEERKDEVIRIYHTQHPHPTWEHVSDILYLCGGEYDNQQYHNVLDRLQSMFPTGEYLSLQPRPRKTPKMQTLSTKYTSINVCNIKCVPATQKHVSCISV